MLCKRRALACVFIAVLLLGFSATAQADNDGDESKAPRCNPAGVWFVFPSGNPPYKVASVIPIDGGKKRYIVDTEGQDPMETSFHGEMARVKKNVYKFWGTKYAWYPPLSQYLYIVNSGYWSMIDCNTAELEILNSIYDEDPFHNDDATPIVSRPRRNLWVRMPVVDDSSSF